MDPFGNDEIARLLRLKRYEQPPPAYFENFLHEFRRRQRDQLFRQPLWRICFARAGFRGPVQRPLLGILRRRYRGSGRVHRSNFNHDLSATRHYSVRSRERACSKHATSKCRKRIQPCASGGASDVQPRADSSAKKLGYSVAAG